MSLELDYRNKLHEVVREVKKCLVRIIMFRAFCWIWQLCGDVPLVFLSAVERERGM